MESQRFVTNGQVYFEFTDRREGFTGLDVIRSSLTFAHSDKIFLENAVHQCFLAVLPLSVLLIKESKKLKRIIVGYVILSIDA